VVAEDGQGVGDPVAQVGSVVVAVQLDVLQAGLGQASGTHIEGLLAEPPVGPGHRQTALEPVRMIGLERGELVVDALAPLVDAL
jgi:hypothetical protein